MTKNTKGQIVLVVLLVMAIGLTVGLAAVSRSVTDIRITRQEEESARAFSAAEAGIEQALVGGGIPTFEGLNVQVDCPEQGGSQDFNFGGAKYSLGDTQTAWLIGHNGENLDTATYYSGGTVDVYWGNSGASSDGATTPAVETILLYRQSGEYKIGRYPFDPNSTRRTNENKFGAALSAGYTLAGTGYQFKQTITLPSLNFSSGDRYYSLRIRLLYNTDADHVVGIKGVSTLPSQGVCCESSATVQATGVTRKVKQCQFHKAPPEIFDYALYSEGDLVK